MNRDQEAELLNQYVDIINTHGTHIFGLFPWISRQERRFLNEHASNQKLMRLCKTTRAMKTLYSDQQLHNTA